MLRHFIFFAVLEPVEDGSLVSLYGRVVNAVCGGWRVGGNSAFKALGKVSDATISHPVRSSMSVCHVTLHDYVTHRYILMYGAVYRKLVKGTGIYRGGIPLGFPYAGSSIAQAWKFIIRS